VTLFGAAFVGACAESRESATAVTVRAVVSGPRHAVDVDGVPPARLRRLTRLTPTDSTWARVVTVYVDDSGRDSASKTSRRPAIIGRAEVVGGRIRFEPRFAFTPGVAYRVVVDTAALARLARGETMTSDSDPEVRLEHRFAVPATAKRATTRVVAVHPSAERLPSNLLRWYIELSAPMAPGNALEHIRLLDESGREVGGAFLALDQELWDPERRRLTLLHDPGRVKRGVRTNVESGAALVAERRYRLVIDSEWRDGTGAPLTSGFEQAFDVADADRASPDPSRWRITAPTAGTRDDLRVGFAEPLDHALASRMVSVQRVGGATIPGTRTLVAGDSAWSFTPTSPWAAGDYVLRVNSALEDVAGNSVARVFDADRHAGGIAAETAAAMGPHRQVRFRISAP